ncbi:hypothetical protein [Aeoliella sp. SH292]|uniref:hypothetical protein n=1 Tax=Aeoliella sp. SH292 TaxID=3454464 RepID=UPI003F976139
MTRSPAVCVLVCLVLSSTLPTCQRTQAALASDRAATDFAVFSKKDIRLETYSTVQGDVYAANDILIDFALGIQEPERHRGDYYAGRNLTTSGGLHDFEGSLWANGSIQFQTGFGVDVTGDVTYGNTFTNVGNIAGTINRVGNTVPDLRLPMATPFSPGTLDLTINDDRILAPGSYGDVIFRGLYDELHLSGGDYYFNSLTKSSSAYLYLDLTNGPINIYIAEDLIVDPYLFVYVNGVPIGASTPLSIQQLASDVLFEVHGEAIVETGGIGSFFGTLFTPFGDATLRGRDFYGSVISGGAVNLEGYIVHYPSNTLAVPEPPSTFAGMVAAVLVLGFISRETRLRRAPSPALNC